VIKECLKHMVRFMDKKKRKVGEDGRIGYTWRLLPEEAAALDALVEKNDYADRTAWFRERVLHLAPLVRATKEKPAKKPKKGAAKAA
jgi:hypothetical protein